MDIEKVLSPMREEHAQVQRLLKKGFHSMSGDEFAKLVTRQRHLHCTLRTVEEFVRKELKASTTSPHRSIS